MFVYFLYILYVHETKINYKLFHQQKQVDSKDCGRHTDIPTDDDEVIPLYLPFVLT